jgi:hypothetical protein
LADVHELTSEKAFGRKVNISVRIDLLGRL